MDYFPLRFRIIFVIFFYTILVSCLGSISYGNLGISNLDILQDDVFFEIVEPPDISYTYRTRPAKNFGTSFSNEFHAKNIGLVPVEPAEGCTWPENADKIKDNVALVQRGHCSFLSKAVNMEKAGAKAVIIADNVLSEELYIDMADDMTGQNTNIPACFLLGKNGYIIRKTLIKKNLDQAVINIPVNLTFVSIEKMNQPPWLIW